MDVASGTIRQLTHRKGVDTNPMPSPDGKLIAYVGDDWNDDTYRNNTVYVMGRDGSNPSSGVGREMSAKVMGSKATGNDEVQRAAKASMPLARRWKSSARSQLRGA